MNSNLIWTTTDITPSRTGMSAGRLPRVAPCGGHRVQAAVLVGAGTHVASFAGPPAWSTQSW